MLFDGSDTLNKLSVNKVCYQAVISRQSWWK